MAGAKQNRIASIVLSWKGEPGPYDIDFDVNWPEATDADIAYLRLLSCLRKRRRTNPPFVVIDRWGMRAERTWPTCDPDDPQELVRFLSEKASRCSTVRLSTVTPSAYWIDEKGPVRLEEATGIDALHVDLDFSSASPKWATYETSTPPAILRRLRKAGLPEPTALIATGGGWHVVWLLSRRLSLWRDVARRNLSLVRSFLGAACSALGELGADAGGSDTGRCMRVPLSWNGDHQTWSHVLHLGMPLSHGAFLRVARNSPRVSIRRRPAELPNFDRGRKGDWQRSPLLRVLRQCRIPKGSRNRALTLLVAAMIRLGASEKEIAEEASRFVTENCEPPGIAWRSTVRSILRARDDRRPYGLSPTVASWIEARTEDGEIVDLAPLVMEHIRWEAARANRNPTRRNISVVESICRVAEVAAWCALGRSFRPAPKTLSGWAEAAGIRFAGARRAFEFLGELGVARTKVGSGSVVDGPTVCRAAFWKRLAVALTKIARRSIRARRAAALVRKLLHIVPKATIDKILHFVADETPFPRHPLVAPEAQTGPPTRIAAA